MHRVWFAIAALVVVLSPSYAQASPIVLDFTDAAVYGGATGQTDFNVADQGVAVSLAAHGLFDNLVSYTLEQTSEGIGVDGPIDGLFGDDPGEIGYLELLSVSLSPSVFLHAIYIQQLERNCGFLGCVTEDGYYRINGGGWINFAGTNSGLITLAINQAGVTSLDFAVGLDASKDLFDDYSVAGLKVEAPTTVPEPATFLLLSVSVLGLAARRRAVA